MGTIAFPNIPQEVNQTAQTLQAQPNAMQEYARVAALKQQTAQSQQQTALEQQQTQQVATQNQIQQQAFADQKAGLAALQDPAFKSMNDLPDLIQKHGGSFNAITGARSSVLDYNTKLQTYTSEQLKNEGTKNDLVAGHIDTIKNLPPDQQPAAFENAKADLVQKGDMTPQEAAQTAYRGPDGLDALEKMHMAHSAQVDQQLKQSQANEASAKARKEAADAAHQEFVNNLTKNSKPGDFDTQVDAIVPPTGAQGQAQNQFVKGQVNGFLSRGDLENANKALENAYQSQLGVAKDIAVATNPQIQAGKVAVAGAEGAARQNAINNPPLPGNPALSGDAYIRSLPPAMQATVRQIGTGRMALSRLDYLLSRNPQVLDAVAQAYPDFDSSKVKSYTDTYKDFTAGKTSVALNSGGTALGHLKELRDLNTNESHIPHTPAWTAYQNKAATVASELAKFYGEPTIPAINAIKETLTSTLPGNRESAIRTQAQSMGDKLDAYEQQWHNAAPSSAYQAPLPGISTTAKRDRAELDPDYGARIGQGEGGGQSGGAKVATSQHIADYAKAKGISVQQATQEFKQSGYTIQ